MDKFLERFQVYRFRGGVSKASYFEHPQDR